MYMLFLFEDFLRVGADKTALDVPTSCKRQSLFAKRNILFSTNSTSSPSPASRSVLLTTTSLTLFTLLLRAAISVRPHDLGQLWVTLLQRAPAGSYRGFFFYICEHHCAWCYIIYHDAVHFVKAKMP